MALGLTQGVENRAELPGPEAGQMGVRTQPGSLIRLPLELSRGIVRIDWGQVGGQVAGREQGEIRRRGQQAGQRRAAAQCLEQPGLVRGQPQQVGRV